MNNLNIAIIGAGVGGLAAAIALQNAGHHVSVYESAPALGEVGAGITMTPNASKALRSLGVFDAVQALALKPDATRYRRFDTGEVVATVRFDDTFEERYGAPLITIHRADLLTALANAVQGSIHTGHELTTCGERNGKAFARFANGVEVSADIVIGADGVRSAAREQIHGPQAPRFSGHVAFRGLVPIDRLSAVHHTADTCVWVGGGQHVVQYAIKQGTLMNYVIISERGGWTDEGWGIPATVAEVRDEFVGWHHEFTEMLDSCDPDALIKWGLFGRDPQQPWHRGPISLLGDAVHPTVPFMAQGGAMALEDGLILARSLAAASTPEQGLSIYEHTRFERTSWVSAKSLFFGELFHSVAGQAQISQERRAADEVLYRYDPVTAPLADS